jgi:hypothetical protein
MIKWVSRELGRPCRLYRDCRLEPRLTNSRLIHGSRPEPVGTNWGRTDGIAKRRCTDESQVPSIVMTARARLRLGARNGPWEIRRAPGGDSLKGHAPRSARIPADSRQLLNQQ